MRALALMLAVAAAVAAGQTLVVPRLTSVRVETVPDGARVYGQNYSSLRPDQGMLGVTPCTLLLDRNSSHPLWIIRSGYQDQRIVVDAISRDHQAPPHESLLLELSPSQPTTAVSHWMRWHPIEATLSALLVVALLAAVASRLQGHVSRLSHRLEQALDRGPNLVGRTVGNYQVVELLGEGAYSRVYRVWNPEARDWYALKILKADAVDASSTERFSREGELGLDLRHPGLVKMYAVGTHHGAPYLVMELVRGQTLGQWVADHRPEVTETLTVLRQVCEAVSILHQNGIVHRDLKPENIMVLEDGTVRVLDFGAAKCLDTRRLTATGTALGTPLFMSPEHLNAREVDERSDIYSLGLVAFYALTGVIPFDGADATQVIAARIAQSAPRLRDMDPELPLPVDTLVSGMLAQWPENRVQSLAEVVLQLDSVIESMRGAHA